MSSARASQANPVYPMSNSDAPAFVKSTEEFLKSAEPQRQSKFFESVDKQAASIDEYYLRED